MLLTINGEADHGKDYVADWCAKEFDLVKISLADPMKRFCRMLFGFPVENLWGPSEKRNEVLDATAIWGSAFSQLHTLHQFTIAVVPESLGPDVRAKAFGTMQDWFTNLRKNCGEKISARYTLQTLGTEWGRSVSDTLWVDYLLGVQLPLLAQGYVYTPTLGIRTNLDPEPVKRGIVIPDIRFANELTTFSSRGSYNTRVRRLSRVKTDGSNVGIQGHQSEQEQRGIPDEKFDKVFNFPEGLEIVDKMLHEWAIDQQWARQ